MLKSQAISGATGLAFEGVFKAGGYLWRELRGVKRGEIVPAEKIQEAIAKDIDRGIATSVENGSGRIKNTDGLAVQARRNSAGSSGSLAAGADAGLARAYLGADSALTDAGQGMVKGSQPTYREMLEMRGGIGRDAVRGYEIPDGKVTSGVTSGAVTPAVGSGLRYPVINPVAKRGVSGYNGNNLLELPNNFKFLERSMSGSAAWATPDKKLQLLKDTVAARKLNISLDQYRRGLKIIGDTQKEFARIFSKRIRDRLDGGGA